MKKYIVGLLLACTSLSLTFAQSVTDSVADQIDCATLTYNMNLGSKDSRTNGDVTTLQTYLSQANYLDGDPTGYYGQATKRAVKAFQSAHGITPQGNVGPYTRAAIKTASCGTNISVNSNTTTNAPSTPTTVVATGQSATAKPTTLPDGTLTPPNLAVYSPAEGTVLTQGQATTISWQANSSGSKAYYIVVGAKGSFEDIEKKRISDSDISTIGMYSAADAHCNTGSRCYVSWTPTLSAPRFSLYLADYSTMEISGSLSLGSAFSGSNAPNSTVKMDYGKTGVFSIVPSTTATQPTTSAPTCSITTDKSIYALGDTINVAYTTQNASYAAWKNDTTGKDNFVMPGDKLATYGSYSFKASITGNPSITLGAYSSGGSGTCTKVIPVSYSSQAPTVSYVSPSTVSGSDVVSVYGANFDGATFVAIDNGAAATIQPAAIKLSSPTLLSFQLPDAVAAGVHQLSVSQKAGNWGMSSPVSLTVAQKQSAVPTITTFFNKGPDPTTGRITLVWGASGSANIVIDMACSVDTFGVNVDNGNRPTCGGKNGLGVWRGFSAGTIGVTPLVHTTPVTVTFTLTLMDQNGNYTNQKQSTTVVFPVVTSAPVVNSVNILPSQSRVVVHGSGLSQAMQLSYMPTGKGPSGLLTNVISNSDTEAVFAVDTYLGNSALQSDTQFVLMRKDYVSAPAYMYKIPTIDSFTINGSGQSFTTSYGDAVVVYNATNPVISWTSSNTSYCSGESYDLVTNVATQDFLQKKPVSGYAYLNIGDTYVNQRRLTLTCFNADGMPSSTKIGIVGGKG